MRLTPDVPFQLHTEAAQSSPRSLRWKYALLQSDEELKEFLGIKPAVLIKFKHEVEQRMKGLEGVKILETESETFYQEINGIRVCKK